MLLPKKVLIVEDDVVTQGLLKEILAQLKISDTTCVDNAKDAMLAIVEGNFDMILMDINIKGAVDGIQLTNRILDNYVLPIVFITGHYDDEILEEVLEVAPYGFALKPISKKDLKVILLIAYKRFITHEKTHSYIVAECTHEHITINDTFTYSLKMGTLYHNERPVRLSIKQNNLIEALSKSLNHPISYDALITLIWEGDPVSDSSLRTLVYSIRKLIPTLPLFSHSKIGYGLGESGVF